MFLFFNQTLSYIDLSHLYLFSFCLILSFLSSRTRLTSSSRCSSAFLRRSSSLIFCILSSWRQNSCRSDSNLASARRFSSSAFILASSAFHNSSLSMFDFDAFAYLLRLWMFVSLWFLDVDLLLFIRLRFYCRFQRGQSRLVTSCVFLICQARFSDLPLLLEQ